MVLVPLARCSCVSDGHGQQLKPGCLHAQVVGLAGVELQAIQAGEDAGASEDEAMDQGGESDGDDSDDGSEGLNLYEEGNDVRGCRPCQTPAARCCLLQVCVHNPKCQHKAACRGQDPAQASPQSEPTQRRCPLLPAEALQKTSLLPAGLLCTQECPQPAPPARAHQQGAPKHVFPFGRVCGAEDRPAALPRGWRGNPLTPCRPPLQERTKEVLQKTSRWDIVEQGKQQADDMAAEAAARMAGQSLSALSMEEQLAKKRQLFSPQEAYNMLVGSSLGGTVCGWGLDGKPLSCSALPRTGASTIGGSPPGGCTALRHGLLGSRHARREASR